MPLRLLEPRPRRRDWWLTKINLLVPQLQTLATSRPSQPPFQSQSITKARRSRKHLARVRAHEKHEQRRLEHRRRINESIAQEKITYQTARYYSRLQKRVARESQQKKKQAEQAKKKKMAKKKIIMRATRGYCSSVGDCVWVRCCWEIPAGSRRAVTLLLRLGSRT